MRGAEEPREDIDHAVGFLSSIDTGSVFAFEPSQSVIIEIHRSASGELLEDFDSQ
jgi:hypothetical protein